SPTLPTAAQVQTYLNKFSALNGNVQVFGKDGGPFSLVYINNLAFTDANQVNLVPTTTGGTFTLQTFNGLTAGAANSGNEIQTLTFGGTPTTGTTFTLNFNGLTSNFITFDTNGATLAANIQSALDALLGGNPSIRNAVVTNYGDPNVVTILYQNAL